jgi:hypothetical protein
MPQRGHHSFFFFAGVGNCDIPNFRGPVLAIATLDQWVIDVSRRASYDAVAAPRLVADGGRPFVAAREPRTAVQKSAGHFHRAVLEGKMRSIDRAVPSTPKF